MRTDDAFLYTNDTELAPPRPERLERVFGCGRSCVVDYTGTGAYFLDKLGEGQWRLEVYPDAVWIDDPHAPTSLQREVSRVLWTEQAMSVRLPDLGGNFSYQRIAPQAGGKEQAKDGRLAITPGAYILAREGRPFPEDVRTDFWAPSPQDGSPAVWWQGPKRWREGVALPVRAVVAAQADSECSPPHRGQRASPHGASSTLCLRRNRARRTSFRRHNPGNLGSSRPRRALIGSPQGPLRQPERREPFPVLQVDEHTRPRVSGSPGCKVEIADGNMLRVEAGGFDGAGAAAGLRLPAEQPAEAGYDMLIVRARATRVATDRVELGLVQTDGKAYGTEVSLWTDWHDVRVPLAELRPLWGTTPGRLDVTTLDQLSLVFGTWLYGPASTRPHGFEIRRIWLEQSVPGWTIDVTPADGPVLLFAAGDKPVRAQGQDGLRQSLVRGTRPGSLADRVWTSGFGPPPSSVSMRYTASENLAFSGEALPRCNALEIVARAVEPQTDKLEVVLVEQDSAAWGTIVPLTQEWQRIVVPLSALRFFNHWPHPESRGGSNDHLRTENLAAVNFCFGAWLYGDRAGQPHGIEPPERCTGPRRVAAGTARIGEEPVEAAGRRDPPGGPASAPFVIRCGTRVY